MLNRGGTFTPFLSAIEFRNVKEINVEASISNGFDIERS